MNELKDLLEDLQDYFSNKSDAETVANVEYMLAQRIREQLASPSEEEIELPPFLYKNRFGEITIGVHGDTVVTEEWNKWLAASLRSSSEQELKENFKWSSWLRPHTSNNQSK
jgi:hypothetical protein